MKLVINFVVKGFYLFIEVLGKVGWVELLNIVDMSGVSHFFSQGWTFSEVSNAGFPRLLIVSKIA